jgi:TIR domain-containing protein
VARQRKTKVFVSYSRHDECVVRPLASLLGIASDDAVFLDVEQLNPGDLWETKIADAIRESSVFVICWCCECQKSAFVIKEVRLALKDPKKKVVPVLFCTTELPHSVGGRQWIDLRGRVVHTCNAAHLKEGPAFVGGVNEVGRAITLPPRISPDERTLSPEEAEVALIVSKARSYFERLGE